MATNLFPTGVRLNDANDILTLVKAPLTAYNVAGPATLPAGAITGGDGVVLISSNAAPGTQTTRTELQMYGDDPTAYPGQGFTCRICNSGAGTLTLAAGAGVTLSGTMTIATATWRDFNFSYGGTAQLPVATITNIGTGTYT